MERISRIGFELECEVSDAGRRNRKPITDYAGLGVQVGQDGSIRHCGDECYDNGRQCVEFRSNPYVSLEKFDRFFKHIEALRKADLYHFNDSMGFHVHVSFTETETDSITTPKTIYSPAFVKFFNAKLKKELPEVYEKRGQNHFCAVAGIREGRTVLDRAVRGGRYQAVNFRALDGHGTVEFRIFPADTPEKLKAYLHFVEDTVNEFLSTDEGRVHYSAKDHLPPISVRNVGNEVYTTKALPSGRFSRWTADGNSRVLQAMRKIAQSENVERHRKGERYSANAVNMRVNRRVVPVYTASPDQTRVAGRTIPTIRIIKKKTTISNITKKCVI